MKKLTTVVFAILLAGSLSFAQDTGGDKGAKVKTEDTTGKKPTKTSKAHKGGKKTQKVSNEHVPPTPPPPTK